MPIFYQSVQYFLAKIKKSLVKGKEMLTTLYHFLQFLSIFLLQEYFKQMFQMCSLICLRGKIQQ